MKKTDVAIKYFEEGFACSQSVLVAFASDFNIPEKTALRLASGFGGGMGERAETCGAITGAFCVIGLKYGQTSSQDKAGKEVVYQKVREAADKFKERNFGCILCKSLLRCDISTKAGKEEAIKNSYFKDLCPKFIKDAIEITEELIGK